MIVCVYGEWSERVGIPTYDEIVSDECKNHFEQEKLRIDKEPVYIINFNNEVTIYIFTSDDRNNREKKQVLWILL